MLQRGVRNFVFLGLSGCDKPKVNAFIAELRREGASNGKSDQGGRGQ